MKFLLAGFLVVQLFVSNAYAEDPIDAVNDVAQELNLDLDEEFYFSTEPTNEPVSNPPIVKVESTSIKLLGKGVVNRETGESIGLACIVQNCSELRMFYVDSTHTSGYLVGSIIRVTENQADPTRKQIKTTLRKLSQEFRGMKNKNVGLGTYLLKVFGTFTAVSGVGIVVGSTIGVVFLPAMLGTSYLFFATLSGAVSTKAIRSWFSAKRMDGTGQLILKKFLLEILKHSLKPKELVHQILLLSRKAFQSITLL